MKRSGDYPKRRAQCPDAETWLRWYEDRVNATERSLLESHLRSCDVCAYQLDRLGRKWSLDAFNPPPVKSQSGPATLAMLRQLAQIPKDVAESLELLPQPASPPDIPGLTELTEIGHGGMSVVYHAHEVAFSRSVAVKVVATGGNQILSRRTQREVATHGFLVHPNIVRIYRSGVVGEIIYIVMEWVAGGTLGKLIETNPPTPRNAARLARDLARALGEVHALGIVHRDLKPNNILLEEPEGPGQVPVPKLADFGLALLNKEPGLTETGIVMGTPSYMAPEQTGLTNRPTKVGPATDIHGLGALLYAMLTGHGPYKAANSQDSLALAASGKYVPIGSARPDLPTDLCTIIEKCLALEPLDRYRTAGEVADELGRFLDGRPLLARPVSFSLQLIKWIKREPLVSALAVALIIASAFAAGSISYQFSAISSALNSKSLALTLAEQARDNSRQALARLTDESVERLIKRGRALDEDDRNYLLNVRKQYLDWPLLPDPQASVLFKVKGLMRIAELFWQVDQYDQALLCRQDVTNAIDEGVHRGYGSEELTEQRAKNIHSTCMILTRLKRFEEVEELSRELLANQQSHPISTATFQLLLGKTMFSLGDGLSDQGRFAESERWVTQGLALFRKTSLENPENAEIHLAEVRALYNAAICSSQSGQQDEQQARIELQIKLAEEGMSAFAENYPDFAHGLLVGLTMLAEIQIKLGQRDLAEETVKHRMKLAQEALNRFPDDRLIQGEAIHAATQYFKVLSFLGRPGDAAPMLEAAEEQARTLARAEPAVYDRTRLLASVLFSRAEMLALTDHTDAAIREYQQIITSMNPWRSLEGRVGEVNDVLISSSELTARLLSGMGKHARAVQYLENAIELATPEVQTHLRAFLEQEQQALNATSEN